MSLSVTKTARGPAVGKPLGRLIEQLGQTTASLVRGHGEAGGSNPGRAQPPPPPPSPPPPTHPPLHPSTLHPPLHPSSPPLTAGLVKAAGGQWLCSGAEWPHFRPHFPCNLQADCLGGEDEVGCPYVTAGCGLGRLDLHGVCYRLQSGEGRTWYVGNTLLGTGFVVATVLWLSG